MRFSTAQQGATDVPSHPEADRVKRLFLKQLGLMAAGCAVAPWALAQSGYPDHAIRIIVPFPPGGSVDPIIRIVAPKLSELLNGQAVIIDNRAGGNTAIGAGMVAKATPDGYTLLFTAASTHVIHTLQSKLPYDSIKDFAPVAAVSRSSYMMAVNAALPVHTLPELIAYAKANPGKLNYGSSGVGNSNHLAMELFNIRAGVKIVHVPYKGGAPALLDFTAGRVQVMLTNIPLLQPQIDNGKLRAIAYTQPRPGKPDDPTFSQYGLSGFDDLASINALLAPAGTPEAVIAKISAAVKTALAMPDVKKAIANEQQDAYYLSPAELGEHMRNDRDRFVEVIDKAHIDLMP